MEKIKITKIGIKQQPSKFKPGETYSIVTILDTKNRKMTAMGKWAEGWKVGDIIEAEVKEKKWTDKDGFEQTNLALDNPNKQAFTPRGGGFNPMINAYQIAAELAPLLFAGKKKVELEDIDKLAIAIKSRFDAAQPAAVAPAVEVPKKEKVKEIDVDKEDEKSDDDLEVTDDDDDDF